MRFGMSQVVAGGGRDVGAEGAPGRGRMRMRGRRDALAAAVKPSLERLAGQPHHAPAIAERESSTEARRGRRNYDSSRMGSGHAGSVTGGTASEAERPDECPPLG